MNCEDLRINLSPYLDEWIDRENHQLISQHLEECASCKKYFEEHAALDQELSELAFLGLPQVDPERSVAMWKAQAANERNRPFWVGWGRRSLMPLATLLIMLLINFLPTYWRGYHYHKLDQRQVRLLKIQTESHKISYQVKAMLTYYNNSDAGFSLTELRAAIIKQNLLGRIPEVKAKAIAEGNEEMYQNYTRMEALLLTILNEQETDLREVKTVVL